MAVAKDSRVSGNALVSGNAQVGGNALVYDNAQVYDEAQVYGNALVSGEADIGAPHHVQTVSVLDGVVTIYRSRAEAGWESDGPIESLSTSLRDELVALVVTRNEELEG